MRRFKALCWHTPEAPRRSQHALSWVGGRACREGQAAVTCSEARRWHEPPQRLGMQLRRGRARSVASAPTLVAPSDLLPAPSFGDGRSFRGDRACVTCPLRPSLLRQSQSLVPRAASGPMTARRRGGVIALNLPVARHVAGRQLAPYGAPKRGMRGGGPGRAGTREVPARSPRPRPLARAGARERRSASRKDAGDSRLGPPRQRRSDGLSAAKSATEPAAALTIPRPSRAGCPEGRARPPRSAPVSSRRPFWRVNAVLCRRRARCGNGMSMPPSRRARSATGGDLTRVWPLQ
jgi:hypothetical protein